MRKALRVVLFVLMLLTAWMSWANVLSDDPPLREKAQQVARAFAGCGDKCRLLDIHGDRGMITTEVGYTFDKFGQVVVTCRRPYIAFGEHVCTAAKP